MAKPDYAFWAAQPEYSLTNASWLCCDMEPETTTRDNPEPPRVRSMYLRLDREVAHTPSSWIETVVTGPAWGTFEDTVRRITHYETPFVLRVALKEWAEATGQRAAMPFLFTEDLAAGDPGEDSLRADTKEGYLFLIGLLVHALAEKGGPDLRTPRGDPKPAGILRQLERVAQNLKVGMDGLGKSQGNEKLSVALAEIENRRRELPPSP